MPDFGSARSPGTDSPPIFDAPRASPPGAVRSHSAKVCNYSGTWHETEATIKGNQCKNERRSRSRPSPRLKTLAMRQSDSLRQQVTTRRAQVGEPAHGSGRLLMAARATLRPGVRTPGRSDLYSLGFDGPETRITLSPTRRFRRRIRFEFSFGEMTCFHAFRFFVLRVEGVDYSSTITTSCRAIGGSYETDSSRSATNATARCTRLAGRSAAGGDRRWAAEGSGARQEAGRRTHQRPFAGWQRHSKATARKLASAAAQYSAHQARGPI